MFARLWETLISYLILVYRKGPKYGPVFGDTYIGFWESASDAEICLHITGPVFRQTDERCQELIDRKVQAFVVLVCGACALVLVYALGSACWAACSVLVKLVCYRCLQTVRLMPFLTPDHARAHFRRLTQHDSPMWRTLSRSRLFRGGRRHSQPTTSMTPSPPERARRQQRLVQRRSSTPTTPTSLLM